MEAKIVGAFNCENSFYIKKSRKKEVGNPAFPSKNGGRGKQFKLLQISMSPSRFESRNAVSILFFLSFCGRSGNQKGCQNWPAELAHPLVKGFLAKSWRNNFTPINADAQDLDFFYKPGFGFLL
ncbi:hypothetical protein CEXT_673681 [Caerostris extrusa]|uniref:Uncharacterized protein n=1 Tax=Caerostris extrusa TaxID=172846 RepID=A0AAV4Y3Y9_CAEEX|nr:hypothetical protein CEXT_673681 [Caerostris extrusa]